MKNQYLARVFNDPKWLGIRLQSSFLAVLCSVALLVPISNLKAQVSSYSFGSSTQSYTPITGGTNLTGFTSSTTYLDAGVIPAVASIGFTFNYNGVGYTQFAFGYDGWVSLGGTLPSSTSSPLSGSLNNVISGMGADLICRGSLLISTTTGSPTVTVTGGDINLVQVGDRVSGTGLTTASTVLSKTSNTITLSSNATTTGTGRHMRFVGPNAGIRYETIGTAPNRVLVVQWTGWQRYTATVAFGELYNFQIRLEETTNKVSIVYNNQGPTSTTAASIQVGIRGISSTDFSNRTNTTSWDNSSAGTSNTATMTLSNTVFPASGLTYTWTPPQVCSGSPSASTVTPAIQSVCLGSTPGNLTSTGQTPGFNGFTYQWEQSTDAGQTWVNAVGGSNATTLVYTPPVFNGPSIQYRLATRCTTSSQVAYSSVAQVDPPSSPGTQASALTATSTSQRSLSLSWTSGTGARRMVVISNTPIVGPSSGSGPALTANTVYAGSGQQIVFDGTGTSVSITGLTCGTTYYTAVFDYNRCGAAAPFDYYYNTSPGSNVATFATSTSVALPVNEDFATTTAPANWTTTGWTIGSARGVTGNPGNNIYRNLWSSATTGTFTTAVFGPMAAGYRLKFDYKLANYASPYAAPAAGWGNFKVSLGTNCASTFNLLDSITNAGTGWVTKIYNLSNYTSGDLAVKVDAQWLAGDYDLAFDNFVLEPIPACDAPSALTAGSVTDNSASLSWTASASSNNYEVAIQAAGAGAPAGSGVAVTGTTYAATGLNAATNYGYYVRTVCSGANSPWAGPFAFSTAVCNAANTCNYTINMTDTYGDGWDGTVIGLRQSGILVGTFGGTGFATGGSATATIALCPGLNTEIVLVTAGSYPEEKRFTILSPFGVQVYALTTATTPLPAVFGSFTSSCTPPACQVPSGLAASAVTETGATIAWTVGGSETSWEISIQAPGLGAPTGNGTAITSNPYVATGLTSNTSYQVYLRAVCSPTNKSNWIGPVNIRTLCGTFATPLFESFEITQGTAYCWSGNFAAGSTPGWQWIRLPAGSAPSNQTPALPDTMAMRIPFYGISSGSFSLNSPTFTATTGQSVLKFNYAYAAYSAAEIDQLEVLASSDAGANYTSLVLLDGGPSGPLNTGGTTTSSFVPTSAQWGTKQMLLPAGTNKVSFKGISAYGNNLYLDNVAVTPCGPSSYPQSASICQGQTYAFGTQSLTAAGVYTRTLVASNGCDSVVTLTLTVKPLLSGSFSASICQGQQYSFGGQSLAVAGTYTNTVPGSNGCDSTVTLNLTVLAPATSSITQTVPNGGSYTVCGEVYNASGTYTKVCAGAAANGCDSVVTLNLTVEPAVSVTIGTKNACYLGDTVSVPVSMAYGRGVGAISLAINYDPSKLVFVDAVDFNSALSSTMIVNAGVFGGQSQVRAGWYATASPLDLNGRLFNLRFVALSSDALAFDLATPGNCEIADFDAIPFAGASFNNGAVSVGQMLQVGFSVNGTVLTPTSNTVSICRNESFQFGLASINNGSGPLNLTWEVLDANNAPVSGFPTSASGVNLGATLFNQNSPLTPGTYVIRATSIAEVNGCAIPAAVLAQYYTATVTVKPSASSSVTISIPYGTTYNVCGQTYGASGTYTKVCAGAAANGCDSVVTLNLTVLPSPCTVPSGLAVSGVTASGASFAWTAGGTETQWEISIQTTTGTPTGNGTSITANPYIATGLTSNTLYRVYLRAVCGPANKSLWIGPISFRTLCNVFTLPLFESFETAQGTTSCWSGNFAAGTTPGWQLIRLTAGSAPSNQTPALPDTLAMRLPFYDIVSGSYSLNTPTFTANSVGAVLTFNYAYAAYSSAEIDKLEILASTDGGATYSSLEIMNGGPSGPLNTGGTTTSPFVPTAAQWALKTINLPANTNRVSFKGISEYGNNLYLDNIRVANPPPCSAPTAPAVVANSVGSSTASISWTAPASAPANGYQLFVSTSTTAPDAASVPTRSSSASPAALTGLAPLTTYNVWVRSSCAIGTSSWVGPVSFTTTCLESNIPTSENFDSYVATGGTANTGTAVPPCWSRANGTSTSSAWRVFALTGSNIGSTSGDNILASFPTVTTAKNDWAFTTGYNLVGGTTYTLRFKVRAPGNGPNRERLGIYLANARTSTAMLAGPRIFNDSLLQASGWQSKTARLTPTASGVYYLGIRAYSVANAGYIGIDDWSLEVTTSEIAGTLKYQGGASVLDNSTVTLSGAVSASATTTASGAFAFTGLGNGAVTLTASTNKAWGGITATDALATTRHYQGIGLVSGLNLAAADVNLSALVNATDALMIINRYNGTRNNFPAGDWKFESKNFNLNLSEITTDLFGIAIGDVNNSYSPAAGRQFIGLNLAEGGVQSISDENWMDVRVDRALEMGALSLALDIPSGVRIEQVVSNLEGGRFDYNVHNGQLRLTWFDVAGVKLVAGQSLFRMRIASDRSVAVSDWTVAEGSEIADPLAQVMEMVGLRMPSLRGLQADLVATVYPNPTQGMSSVRLNLPAAGELKLRLVDVLGKVVMSQTVTSQALNTELPVDMSSLAAGRYELQIELNAGGRNYRTHLPVQRRD